MALKREWPLLVVLAAGLALLGWRLAGTGWQARELAEIGSQFSQGEAEGSEGYDGQFVLFMAEDLRPSQVAPRLDVPAYRYQRILLPLLARLLALGQAPLVPWTLILINVMAQLLGTWAVIRIFSHYQQWVGYALHYGLWVGLLGGVGADLHEPLAYGLVAAALWLRLKGNRWAGLGLLGLSLFAKETTLPFLAGFFLADALSGQWKKYWPGYAAIALGFALWQLWLLSVFGSMGLGSGGLGASSFEVVPFLGFFRIATVDPRVFGLFLLLFGPGILLPAAWGALRAVFNLLRSQDDWLSWLLLLNAAVIVVLPFSTFREPFGLVRVASGLILALLVYAARQQLKRPLVYAWFWLAYLPLIL